MFDINGISSTLYHFMYETLNNILTYCYQDMRALSVKYTGNYMYCITLRRYQLQREAKRT